MYGQGSFPMVSEGRLETYIFSTPILFFISQSSQKIIRGFQVSTKAVPRLSPRPLRYKQKNTITVLLCLVGEGGLEPPIPKKPVPKTGASSQFRHSPIFVLSAVFFLGKADLSYNT